MSKVSQAIAGAAFLVLCIASPAWADAVEDFIRSSLQPESFSADRYHEDYQAKVLVQGQTLVLDRAQLVEMNEAVRMSMKAFRITSFRITRREERQGRVIVAFSYGYRWRMGAAAFEVLGNAEAILVPGGPVGYLWLRSVQRDELVESL